MQASPCAGHNSSVTLAEFLKHRRERPASAADIHGHIGLFRTAVERLAARIRDVLRPYEELEIEERSVLLKEEGVPYGAPALTIVSLRQACGLAA